MNKQATRRQGRWAFMAFYGLIVLTVACQPTLDPSQQFGPDGQPRILSVQLAGIPDQNIQIDQETKKISVTIPTNFPAVAVPIQLQFTQNTRVTAGRSDSVYVGSLLPNDTIQIATTTQQTNAYEFVFKSTEPIRFATARAPVSFTVHTFNNNFSIPLFTAATSTIGQKVTLTLTNRASGRRISQPQYTSSYSTDYKPSMRSDGAVYVSVYFFGQASYEPGDYTAEVTTATGDRAVLNQPVRIQRGEITLFFDDSINLSDTTINPTISAANLFPTDKPSFLLRARDRSSVRIEPIKFYTDFNRFDLPTPQTLQPGYYYAQLVLDGKAAASFVRVPVVRSRNDLVIQGFYDPFSQNTQPNLDPSLGFTTPLVLKRTKRYQLTTNSFTVYLYKTRPGDGSGSRVRLTSLTDPGLSYLIPIDENPNLSGNLPIPATVPPGLYQFKFEVLTVEKTVLSSEPLERDVQIE